MNEMMLLSPDIHVLHNNYFGRGLHPIVLHGVHCTGNEDDLSQCYVYLPDDCVPQVAGVRCFDGKLYFDG